ncbi:hypothetical protein MKY15_00200 [Sporosarcina sp. FSL K6-1540]|uniref:Uncharacterized protein n=1 Tax=Sporosarcina psychrophila TaxID=1476 RepID=A0ABV2K5A7_SPOPS
MMDKLKTVSSHIPKGIVAEITFEERTRKLDEAIRLGYSYG